MTQRKSLTQLRFSRPFQTRPLQPAQLFTLTEAAAWLGVCCRELKDLIRAGRVHRVSLAPGEYRITRTSLEAEKNRRNKIKKGQTHDQRKH